MSYRGVIKQNTVVLEEEISLPDGTPVTVIPEYEFTDSSDMKKCWRQFHENADRIFQQLLQETGATSDSATLLRKLREERAAR